MRASAKSGAMKRYRAGACAALLLCDLGLAPGLRAQNATWNGATSSFNASANWLPNSVPTGTAFFGAAGLPGITFSAPATLRFHFQCRGAGLHLRHDEPDG